MKAYRLRRPDGATHDVSEILTGPECTCPEFVADRRPCEHIRAMVACGLIVSHAGKAVNAPGSDDAPMTLEQAVRSEADGYRAVGTPIAAFLARQLDRLAQLVRFTGAADGDEFECRLDVMEQDVREESFNRGYQEGQEAGLRLAGQYQEALV